MRIGFSLHKAVCAPYSRFCLWLIPLHFVLYPLRPLVIVAFKPQYVPYWRFWGGAHKNKPQFVGYLLLDERCDPHFDVDKPLSAPYFSPACGFSLEKAVCAPYSQFCLLLIPLHFVLYPLRPLVIVVFKPQFAPYWRF